MNHTISTTLVSLLLLTGCASHPRATGGTGPSGWWKPGTTDPQEIVQAMARCRVAAAMSSTGSAMVKNPFAARALDKHRQGGVTYDCLIADGYRFARQSEVPAGLAFVPED